MPSYNRYFVTEILAIVLYVGLYFIFYGGYDFTAEFPALLGEASDAHPYNWNAYIFKKALLNGENPFYTDDYFYPNGVNLLMTTYTPLMSVFALPFSNAILGINIFLVIERILSGLGAYLLAKRYSKHFGFCFIAGFAFAFLPYFSARFGEHFTLLLTATIPFYLLLLLQSIDFSEYKIKLTARNSLLAFVLLTLTIFSDYYAFFYLCYVTIAVIIYIHAKVYKFNPFTKRNILLTLIVFVVSHYLVETLKHAGLGDKAGLWWGGDLIGYLTPNMQSYFLYSHFFEGLQKNYIGQIGILESVVYCGALLWAFFSSFYVS